MHSYFSPLQKMGYSINETNIYMKREDLLPFSFGGNKVRIANEFFLDMEQKGKNCIIGYGNARSNLSRAIANINYSIKGRGFIVAPSDDDGTEIETANSLIAKKSGIEIIKCQKNEVAKTLESVFDRCNKEGLDPYYIYGDIYGKSNKEVPVRAYYKVYEEILDQARALDITFDYIFLPVGTGMTQAGLLAGEIMHDGQEKIVGISISRSQEKEETVLFEYLSCFFEFEKINCTKNIQDFINVDDNYLDGGYGVSSSKVKNFIREIFLSTGIPLDPTYTGKAFYGMMEYIKKNDIKKKNILFIHTGGTPLFFDAIREIMNDEK